MIAVATGIQTMVSSHATMLHINAAVTCFTPANRRWWIIQNIAMITKLMTKLMSCW
ncbi:hypothetical protein D3C87_1985640 [compost metagenome]